MEKEFEKDILTHPPHNLKCSWRLLQVMDLIIEVSFMNIESTYYNYCFLYNNFLNDTFHIMN
jgi:hypothetical protein